MSVSAQRALNKAIASGRFDRAYLLYGDDDYLKDIAARQIVEHAVDPNVRDFNVDIRRGADVDAETLASVLSTPPMMAERRVVMVRDVGALRKAARTALDQYLDNPAPDTVVVLVAASTAGVPSRLDRELEQKTTAVEFPVLSEDRIPKWITHHVTELGGRITAEAAELLLEGVGSELPQLAAELDKLVSYAAGAEIDAEAVSAAVGIRPGETVSDLLDAVTRRDAGAAVDLLPRVLSLPKTSAVSIVMSLATQTLGLAWGRVLRDEGRSSSEVERAYFGLLRESSAMTGRPWGEAARAWTGALDMWTIEELDRALDALLAADVTLKESRISSDEQVLSVLIFTMCRPR